MYGSLANQYGYVLLSIVAIAFEVLIIGFVIPQRARKVFTQQFMEQNFGQQHREAFGQDITKQGYPDMGGGIYSAKLSYKDWYEFNSAQRAHYNYVEWIASSIAFLMIAGIYFPIPAACLGLAVFIGRLMYAIGYLSKGPKGRLFGVLINDLAILGAIVLAVISCAFFIQGNQL